MYKKYRVRLSTDERADLVAIRRRGRVSARRLIRARTLLLADSGTSDRGIADALGICARTVERTRQRAVNAGVAAALTDRARPGATPRLDARGEAHLVALACSDPPEGREHWTLQLLAERLVAMDLVTSIAGETVRRTLQKTSSSRG